VVESLSIAREQGASTVGITNYASSPLAKTVETTLVTACHEHRVHFAQSNSMVAQLTLIRALYILVASRCGDEVTQEVDRIEENVKRSLRIKNKRSEQNGKNP
jgi:DNA-binding MurR/RpiR family transcriptional regulator